MGYPTESHIAVEQMLFGDYRVQVWDENQNSLLDREYFCCGELSALMTASELSKGLFSDLPIYEYTAEGIKKI